MITLTLSTNTIRGLAFHTGSCIMHYSPRCLLGLTLPGAGMPIKHCYTKAGWGSSLLPHTRTQQQQAQVQSLRHGPNTRKDNGEKLITTAKLATLIKRTFRMSPNTSLQQHYNFRRKAERLIDSVKKDSLGRHTICRQTKLGQSSTIAKFFTSTKKSQKAFRIKYINLTQYRCAYSK